MAGRAGPQPKVIFGAAVAGVTGMKDGSVKLTLTVDPLDAEKALSMHNERGHAFNFEVYEV